MPSARLRTKKRKEELEQGNRMKILQSSTLADGTGHTERGLAHFKWNVKKGSNDLGSDTSPETDVKLGARTFPGTDNTAVISFLK